MGFRNAELPRRACCRARREPRKPVRDEPSPRRQGAAGYASTSRPHSEDLRFAAPPGRCRTSHESAPFDREPVRAGADRIEQRHGVDRVAHALLFSRAHV
jgi:hypothetical protein